MGVAAQRRVQDVQEVLVLVAGAGLGMTCKYFYYDVLKISSEVTVVTVASTIADGGRAGLVQEAEHAAPRAVQQGADHRVAEEAHLDQSEAVIVVT